MNGVLFVLRGLILVTVILLLTMFFIPEMDAWVHGCWESTQDRFQNITDFLKDREYHVPKQHRRPATMMKDFYKQRQIHMLQQLLRTSRDFRDQQHPGSVMTDGFHDALPRNAKWSDGMVIMGPDVKQEIQDIGRKQKKTEATT